MEDECKQKEEERVNLELELTEVKESLKKALSGGVTLGLTIEPKAGSSSLQVRPPAAPQQVWNQTLRQQLILFFLVCVCSLLRCCDERRSLLPSPAATPVTQSHARCRSTARRCCAASRAARSPRLSGDTSLERRR